MQRVSIYALESGRHLPQLRLDQSDSKGQPQSFGNIAYAAQYSSAQRLGLEILAAQSLKSRSEP